MSVGPDHLRTAGLDVRPVAGAAHAGRLALTGELDVATVPLLEEAVASLVADGRTTVALDVSRVTFCDVPGLNGLISARTDLRALGGELVLHGPCAALQVLLDLVSPQPAMELAPPVTG